jgi:hypothetical protein
MTFRATCGGCGGAGETRPGNDPVRVGIRSQRSGHASIFSPSIFSLCTALLALAIGAFGSQPLFGQHSHAAAPAPHSSSSSGGSHPQSSASTHPSNQPHPPGQQHLNEWMQKNSSLPPDEQIKRLHEEPGFNKLTPQQQQSATNHLQQLNQMTPQQRQRRLEMVENMERLSPQQQQQVRGSARMLSQMPPDRQQAVKDAMRSLRNVPPGQRQSELNSPKYSQLTPQEHGIVGNLLTVEPYHPPTPPPAQ